MESKDLRTATFIFMLIFMAIGGFLLIRYNHERVIIGIVLMNAFIIHLLLG